MSTDDSSKPLPANPGGDLPSTVGGAGEPAGRPPRRFHARRQTAPDPRWFWIMTGVGVLVLCVSAVLFYLRINQAHQPPQSLALVPGNPEGQQVGIVVYPATATPLYWDPEQTEPPADMQVYGALRENRVEMTDPQFEKYLRGLVGQRVRLTGVVDALEEDGQVRLSIPGGHGLDVVYLAGLPPEELARLQAGQTLDFEGTIRDFTNFFYLCTFLDEPVIYEIWNE